MPSATTEYMATLNGLFKHVYAKEIQNLIPDGVKALKMIKFSEADKLGNKFNMPVKVSHPQSITYAAAADGAFQLNDIVAGQTKNAEVDGAQMLLRDAMDYESAARATQGGTKAFVKATRFMVESMIEQMSKRLEIQLFYGRKGLAVVSSYNSSGGYLQIKTGHWAPHIWAGMEGARIEIYNGATKVVGTAQDCYITRVDIVNKRLYVSGSSTELGNVADGHVIYFKSAYGKEFYGLDAIITNTGTLFGIDASQYPLWSGSVYDANNENLSLAKIEDAAALAAAKGGLDENAVCFVSLASWAKLCSDMAALRMFDSSYKPTEGVNGFQAIKFYAINGVVEIIPSGYVKESEAFLLPANNAIRIGATDMTFNIAGQANEDDERFFYPLANYAGFELRLYSHQALLLKTPAKAVKIINISNA